ncbi:hypothetical protein EZV62_000396 [Acer yangbiense]|uniref:Uncharacterized protein n=1 Tax=Acer yangbiense TaxID=1000413 RepID=A0A5C7IQY7_9ROSI|nr:hypothetical protein EZV62_000396 [Acer yangbiense]
MVSRRGSELMCEEIEQRIREDWVVERCYAGPVWWLSFVHEYQKRGEDFWSEFELYLADLLVGVVVDIALVGMLAPYARIWQSTVSSGLFGRIQHACASLSNRILKLPPFLLPEALYAHIEYILTYGQLFLLCSVFEAERPGCKFSVKRRVATYFYKGVLYGSVGFGCGLIGQGIANMVMTAERLRI